jgi:hypothetical protein
LLCMGLYMCNSKLMFSANKLKILCGTNYYYSWCL